MLIMFECTVVAQRLKNLRELRNLQTPKQTLLALRCGKWVKVKGEELLPGDVISIGRQHEGMEHLLALCLRFCMDPGLQSVLRNFTGVFCIYGFSRLR